MRKFAAILVLLAVVLTGCGSTASAAPVRTTSVDLPTSYRFEPARVEVTAGSTVTWTNHDNFTHSVKLDGQSEIHMLRPGEAVQIQFDTPGEFHYVCTLHSQNMQGSVTVR
jgi:plastocyanin